MLTPARSHQIFTTFVFLALFAGCFSRLFLLAPSRHLSADEASGISEAYDYSTIELVTGGPQPELNASPLHYILDKAWMRLAGRNFYQHLNLDLFFRVPPMLYFSAGTALSLFLVLELTGSMAMALPLAVSFAAIVTLFFQTGHIFSWGVAIQDRPIALWIFLSFLHLLLFARSSTRRERAHDFKLTLLGSLLTMNSFAAGTQVLVATLMRAWPHVRSSPRAAACIAMEAIPAGLIGIWFALLGNKQVLDVTTTKQYMDYWLAALAHGTWELGEGLYASEFAGKHIFGDHVQDLLPYALSAPLFFVLPFLSRHTLARRIHLFCLAMLFSAIPTTLVAWKIANSIQPRYFFFLYPYLGILHVLSVLAVAEFSMRHLHFFRKHAMVLVCSLWMMAQATYRLPGIAADWRLSSEIKSNFPLFTKNPYPICPATFGELRVGMKGSIDFARVQSRCLLGIDPPRGGSSFMNGFVPQSSKVNKTPEMKP